MAHELGVEVASTPAHLSRPFERLLVTIWFAGFALLAVSVFFYPMSMTLQGRCQFLALPTISGGIAGFALGRRVLKASGCGSAVLGGIGVALTAFVIFAALFALILPVVEQGWATGQMGSLFLYTLIFGYLMGGPLTVVAGGVAGAALYWLNITWLRRGKDLSP